MGKISNQEVITQINSVFAGVIQEQTEPYGLLTFYADKATIIQLLTFLKEDAKLQFNYLTDITAIHYPNVEDNLEVVYHLHSFVNNVRIRIKVKINTSNPFIPSATNIWNGANWMERETFDFYGVQFEGHPNLVRILNVDDMTVFPMLKEYPLEDPNRVDKKDFFFGR